jgi:hypothetical protein
MSGSTKSEALTTGRATATAVKLEIPKQGWSIAFDSPVLSQPQESKRVEGEYAFRASSGRFDISLFVENPGGPGKTHRDCYAFYWAQSSRNPRIANDTVQRSETPRYARVQYDIIVEFQGQPIRHRNVHYYFVFQQKWVDVHISVTAPTKADEDIFLPSLIRAPASFRGSVAPLDTTASPGRARTPGSAGSA